MLESVGADLTDVLHINVFLKDMRDFAEMNRAYIEMMGDHLPARTVIGVAELPKSGAVLTMNLSAVSEARAYRYSCLSWQYTRRFASLSISIGDSV